MPIARQVYFQSAEELEEVKALAKKAGLSLSNYFRKKAKLELLQQGGSRPRTDLLLKQEQNEEQKPESE